MLPSSFIGAATYYWYTHRPVYAYEHHIKPLQERSLQICKDWTNTECKTAEDTWKMCEQYQAMLQNDCGSYPIKTQIEFDELDWYREQASIFWTDVLEHDKPYRHIVTYEDIDTYLTFHFALQMCWFDSHGKMLSYHPIYNSIMCKVNQIHRYDNSDFQTKILQKLIL